MTQPSQSPVRPVPRSFGYRMKWLVILWCAGFGATFLVVLPFHLLVQWAIHR